MIKATLRKHQIEGIEKVVNAGGSGCFFWDCGTGKTVGAAGLFSYFRSTNAQLRMLVICPIQLLDDAWGADIKAHTTFTFQNLRNGPGKDPDIMAINYEAVLSASGKTLLAQILRANSNIMCVLDESQKIKSHSTKITKFLLSIRHQFKYKLCLSGTPAPNSETEYWPQVTFVNDRAFPPNFFQFRNIYFHLERGNQKMPAQGAIVCKSAARELFAKGWKYSITDKNRRAILSRIDPFAHWVKLEDCWQDAPEQVDEFRGVYLTAEQMGHYKRMKNDLITEISGHDVVATVALAKILKLREIVSGFCITPEGKEVEIAPSSKLGVLADTIEEIGEKQAIIWIEFKWEARKIKEMLGDRCVVLNSDTDDREEVIPAFKEGRVQFLVAHPRSAGHGLTLVNAHVQIFFSLSYSYEMYTQCRARTHRLGQDKTCVYIHLIGKNTIDEVILKCLQRKGHSDEIVKEFIHSR